MKKTLLLIACILVAGMSFAQVPFSVYALWLKNGSAAITGTDNGKIYYDVGLNQFQFRQNGAWLNLPTYGTTTQIPVSNSTGTDFIYSSTFVRDITNNNFYSVSSFTNTNTGTKNNNYIFGISHSLLGGFNIRWATVTGESNSINASTALIHNANIEGTSNTITNSSTNSMFNPSIWGGSNNTITATGTPGNMGVSTILGCRGCSIENANVSLATGYRGRVTGYGGIAMGFFTTYNGTTHTGTVQDVLSSGRHAVNISANSAASVASEGARGDYSGIFGGIDHDVTGNYSIVLGGQGIKLAHNDAVAVPTLVIDTTPANVNTLTQALYRDGSDKKVKYRSIPQATATLDFPSVASLGTQTLTVTVTGAVDGDIVTYSIPNGSKTAGLIFGTAWVSSADTISIECYNSTLAPIDPASGTFKVNVFK